MHEHHKKIAVLYHGGCPDGFAGAYGAWKKFGDEAEYIPVKYGHTIPNELNGKDIFFVDFCYPQPIMDEIMKVAKSVTVLDHHEGVREVATKFPGVFDSAHSGASIAWHYFHPETPMPKLLAYVEDGDLYKFVLPHSREILSYTYTTSPLSSFEHWEALVHEMEDPAELEHIIEIGTIFMQYHNHVVDDGVRHAELVRFEGYECYLTSSLGEFISDTGHALALAKPPIALLVNANAFEISVSLRSDGSVDVSALARKHGGNGHPAAAGFRIPLGQPIPWEVVEKKDEHPRN